MSFFSNRQTSGGGGGEHDDPPIITLLLLIAPMVMKFGMKLDVLYSVVTKNFVTSQLLRNYDVITLF